MKKIIEQFIQRPRTVDVIVGLVILVGLMTVSTLRSNFLPPEPVNFINVSVVYRGASPQEVETEVINKIEDNLDGLKGIDRVTSNASESFAVIRIEMLEDADPNSVLQDVNNAVDKITTFPLRMDAPVIQKEEILNYTMALGITGKVSLKTLKDYAEKIKDDLTFSPNLSQVFISGFPDEEIEVRLREEVLQTYQLTFEEVAQAIQLANIKSSGGSIQTENQEMLIRLNNQEYYAPGLMNITIKTTPDGKLIKLQDIATVHDQFADKPSKSFVNGEQSVIMKIFSRSEEDILQNAEDVNAYVQSFNESNQQIEIIVIEDRSVSLLDAIGNLQNNAWQGILLVMLVLGLFLDPRIAFWVAFKIPVALLGMFILSAFYDLTINQVSLFGLIVVLGVIVDDGVVVAENIYQKFQDGFKPLQAAVDGVIEVIPAILSSLATTALAFSLFFFLDGQLGDYFSDISFVVCATLFIALLESLLILPVHIARSKALKADYKPWKLTQFTNGLLISFRDKVYQPIIGFFVKWPILGPLLVIFCMYLTIGAMSNGTIKGTFFPTIDQDVITAKLELPLGTDESIVNAKLEYIEQKIWEVNEVYSNKRDDGQQVVKYAERVLGPTNNFGLINIYLLEGDTRGILSFEIADSIRQAVGPIPEATNLSYGSVAAFGKPVSIALIGSNMDQLRDAKRQLRRYLESRDDLKDVTDTDKIGMPEIQLSLTEKAKFLGFTEAIVFDKVRNGFFGLEAQSLQRGDEEVKVWLRYDAADRRSVNDILNKDFITRDGRAYPLRELVEVKMTENVSSINHQNGLREIRVEADVSNLLVSVPGVLADAESGVLADIKKQYPRLQYTLEGEARLSSKTQNSSQGPSMVILVFMIGILMLNYRSISKTLAILFMLPFAFVGVAWGTYLHSIPVSIFSVLGMIALWGILINNGLVLISTYNEGLEDGKSVKEAILDAAISRFRPIVLTTITTVFGLAPLLLNNSISAQFLKPTAVAISYGLIFGMVLSLIFLPSVLILFALIKYYFVKYLLRRDIESPAILDIIWREKHAQLN